jgi:hypothetical protein
MLNFATTLCPSRWIHITRQNTTMKGNMLIKALVIDKVSESFDTKKGSKTLHLLVCQDQSRPPLRNSFDFEMSPEEVTKYGATLVDKTVELNVQNISQNFSGRIRMSGTIMKAG